MLVRFDDLPQYRDHVLVDGAFDPLHAGHVAYLQSARWTQQARLLCAVASDDDIRAKGREPLLPQASRASVLDAICDAVFLKDRPTERVIEQLRPSAYIKGVDWKDRLPIEQVEACKRAGTKIVFVDAGGGDSSSARLKAWAASENAAKLEAFEGIAQSQREPKAWKPVTDFSFEARKAIEGKHPQLILETFKPGNILDVGSGPGHLMRLLNDLGFGDVSGLDVSYHQPSAYMYGEDITYPSLRDRIGWNSRWDLVICREVLEHIPLKKIAQAVANLCQLSRKFIYVTTRFTAQPAHVLDVDTADDLDPTHITMLNQDMLRALFVLNGGKRRRDLEEQIDWQQKGRCLVYEV